MLDGIFREVEEFLGQSQCNRLIFQVGWRVYWTYFAAQGSGAVFLYFLTLFIYQGAVVLSSVWLSIWTEDPLMANSTLVNTSQYTSKRDMYLGVYGGFGGVQGPLLLFSNNFFV